MMVHQPSANALGARQDIACGNRGSARSLRTSSDHVFYDIMFFRQDQPQSEGRRHTHLRIKLPPVCAESLLGCLDLGVSLCMNPVG